MSLAIKKAIQALAQVAIIDGRGEIQDSEVVFYHLMEGAPEYADREILKGLDVEVSFHREARGSYAVLRERSTSWQARVPWVHIGLFCATILTTLAAGAMLKGMDIFKEPGTIIQGWPFSMALMAILGTHETGHYIFAKRHRVAVSRPYFIPVPPPITFIGTFGAFIKMKGPMPNRLALLEIGAAGPIAGFLVAVPALLWGLHLSSIVSLDRGGFILGDSILIKLATLAMFPDMAPHEDVFLHPVAFAGWIGLLVTMLNLLPLAQLDGGHIAYALLGERQVYLARAIFAALIPMGIFLSTNWLFWAFLILFLMRTVRHPPVFDTGRPLSHYEIAIGVVCLIIFILCFIPIPFSTA